MNLGDVIKKRRKELGYTLLDIANKMGVSEGTVQRWESGNIQTIRHNKIAMLAEILEVSPSILMGWENTAHENETKDGFSPHERAVIKAYRDNPAMQPAVDRLLGVAPEAPSEAPTVAEDIAATLSAAMEKSRVKK